MTTSTTAPSPAFHAAVAELAAWGAGLPKNESWEPRYPLPDLGLPPGWVPESHLFDHDRRDFLWLARRPGGWVIVSHVHLVERTRVFTADSCLGDLYRRVLASTVSTGRFAPAADVLPIEGARLAAWLKGVLLGMFDPADPVEAAERMLFAMGAPLGMVPRRAR